MRKIFTTMTAFMMVLFSGAMLTACDEEPILYTITYEQSEDYTVTLNKTEAKAGESVEIIIDTGYTIVSVYANNSECDKGEENTYTFIMPAKDVTLSIELDKNLDGDTSLDDEEPILYTITYEQSEDYTVTLNKTEAKAGESVEIIIDTGYTIVSVYANNSECDKGEENTYTFIMPAKDVTLSIELDKNLDGDTSLDDEEPILYTITYEQSEDYIVTLNKSEAKEGENIEITINTEYTITLVQANGIECEKVEENKYSFTMPAENVSLTIELNKNVDLDGTLDITKGNIYIKDLWLEDMAGERITIDNFKPSYINDTFTLPSMILDQEYYTINMEIINLTESSYLINLESDDINVEAYMLSVSLSPNDQDLDGLTQESNGEILIAELCAYATNVDLSALTISFMSF